MDDQSIFIGMAPFVVPPSYQTGLIEFREWLIEENSDAALNPETLRNELDDLLLDYFFDIIKITFDRPMPTLVNTDGELLQFSNLTLN